MMEDEKKLSKEINALERDFAINRKDISSLKDEEMERLTNLMI